MSVSADRLHKRVLDFYPSGQREKATLLPFFDANGKIHRVMIVGQGEDAVRFFSPQEIDLRIGWWGPVRCDTTGAHLRVVEYEDLEPFVSLWHFDPWWLLTSGEEISSQRKKLLMASNCAGKFSEKLGVVPRLYYSRDLSRVEWLMYKTSDQPGWKRFSAKWLPEREPATDEEGYQGRANYSWQLDPFWAMLDK